MCLEWILDHGGSALDQDNSGGTLIHDAAEQGQVRYTLSSSHNNIIDSVHTIVYYTNVGNCFVPPHQKRGGHDHKR